MKPKQNHAKQTFLNLPEDKRTRIVEAAVREFSVQGYRRASINNLVKHLGIAKGALYRYFDSKETLFLFVFDEFTQAVKKAVRLAVSSDTDDFLVLVRQVLIAGLAFISAHPAYYQIYLKVLFEEDVPRRDDLLTQVRLFSHDYFGPLCVAAQKRGAIRDDIAAGAIIFLVDAILDRFFQTLAGARGGEALILGLQDQDGAVPASFIEGIMTMLTYALAPVRKEKEQWNRLS